MDYIDSNVKRKAQFCIRLTNFPNKKLFTKKYEFMFSLITKMLAAVWPNLHVKLAVINLSTEGINKALFYRQLSRFPPKPESLSMSLMKTVLLVYYVVTSMY